MNDRPVDFPTLTTVFTPPPECLTPYQSYTHATASLFNDQRYYHLSEAKSCYPPGFHYSMHGYRDWFSFYGNKCPHGYTTATSVTWPKLDRSFTYCCPNEYDASPDGIDARCYSNMAAGNVVTVRRFDVDGAGALTDDVVAVMTATVDVVWGPAIVLMNREKRIRTSTWVPRTKTATEGLFGEDVEEEADEGIAMPTSLSPDEMASIDGGSEGGLSTGAMVGIGVGVGVVLLAVIFVVSCMIIRQRRQKRTSLAGSEHMLLFKGFGDSSGGAAATVRGVPADERTSFYASGPADERASYYPSDASPIINAPTGSYDTTSGSGPGLNSSYYGDEVRYAQPPPQIPHISPFNTATLIVSPTQTVSSSARAFDAPAMYRSAPDDGDLDPPPPEYSRFDRPPPGFHDPNLHPHGGPALHQGGYGEAGAMTLGPDWTPSEAGTLLPGHDASLLLSPVGTILGSSREDERVARLPLFNRGQDGRGAL